MSREDRIAEVLGEWYERRDRGEEPAPEELVRAHPDLADELRSHFAFLGVLADTREPASGLPPTTPRRIGEFRILRLISRGGMGTVYEAEQTTMGRRVALKVLLASFLSSRQAVKRFEREARAAGRLHHTNIVPIYGMGEFQGLWYYAMELVEGPPLSEVIAGMRGSGDEGARRAGESAADHLGTTTRDRGHFTKVAEEFAGVAEGLRAAHEAGIIHRDIKPQNLLLAPDGVLKIVDFGLARLEGEGGPSMTVTGQLLGTPHYMSPEQAMTKRMPIDRRTDIYSFGATLYEALTLHPPFTGENLQEICSQIITRDPTPPRRRDPRIPRDLETIVVKAMEKDRDRCYQTAEALAEDLRRFATGEPIRARRVGPVARTWRRVRRQKVQSALIAAVLSLACAGGLLGAHAIQEARTKRTRAYLSLCARAEEQRALSDSRAGGIYTEAIELDRDRNEAWFGRALSPGRSLEARLADLDEALLRGLSPRIGRLARAQLRRAAGEPEGTEELDLSDEPWTHAPEEAFFLAHLLAADGRREEARDLLGRAIEGSGQGSAIRHLAVRLRASLRAEDGDFAGALEDLSRARLTDDTVEVRLGIAFCWRRLQNEERARTLFRAEVERARRSGDPRQWLRLCVRCGSLGERGWVLRSTREAVEAHPDSVDLILERAAARLSKEGLERCRRAIELEPGNARAHALLGRALRTHGRTEEAIEAYRRAAELDPGSAQVQCLLGQALAHLGRHGEALAAHEAAIALDPRHGEARKGRGAMLERLGRPEEAVGEYRRAVELQPNLLMARARLDRLLRRLGRHDEARAELERAAASRLGGPGGHHLRAHALTELGRFDEALVEIEAAIAGHARAAFLTEDRADLLVALGRLAEALEQYGAPSAPRGLRGRAVALLGLGRCEEALADLDAVHGDPVAGATRAYALACLDRFEEASAALEPIDELAPEAELALAWRIRTLALLDRYGEALADAEKLQAWRPGRVRERVLCLRGLGHDEEAREIARARVEAEPVSGRGLDLAWLCAVAGEGERARELLDAHDRPWTPATRYRRAAIHAVLGDGDRALEWLQAAVEAGYHRPAGARLDPDFGGLAEDVRLQALWDRLVRR